ncbi:fibril-forming collagen alpha chain-like [Olea europaea var. sylvestris]|uniref:fibril-forming collagen alpha chain-like n=1 Tax=Olea europaea var. sylvestris TaxID=158386 RepID=UPI000C1D0F34|nr:fibril-forming collagen alpha chain-like [Olea europaea var. sylvestris]
MGSAALVLVWSHPSVIAVRANLIAGIDSNRGGTGPAIVGSAELVAIKNEGPASSDEIRCVSAGMVAPVSNCGPSVLDVSAAGGAIATVEGPGQRYAGSDHNRGGTRPAILGSAEPVAIESEEPAGSAWRGEIGEKIASASSAGCDSNRGGTRPAIVGSAEPAAIESEGPAGSAWRGEIAEKNCFSDEKVQCRERSQSRRDRASDCGVHGAGGDRKRKGGQHEDFPGGHPSEYYSRRSTLIFGVLIRSGALVPRRERSQPRRDWPMIVGSAEPVAIESEGPAGVGSDSNLRRIGTAIVRSAEPTAIESEGPAESAWWRGIGEKNFFSGERSSAGSDRNRGGTRPAIVGSAEPVAIESEGPAGSAWRGGIGEENCLSGEKGIDSNRGRTGPAIVGSAKPSAIKSEGPAGRAWRDEIGEKNCFSRENAQGAIATADDSASDCWVRGARGDRKRRASGERMEGRDRGKNCFSGEKAQRRERLQPRIGPANVGSTEPTAIESKGPAGSAWRGGHPSEYYTRPSTFNIGVLTGSGALVPRRERSQPWRDRASDCGVRGAGGDRNEGPAGSAWRVLVWSYPSVISVRAYLMSVQHRANDCGDRKADGDRKRGASEEPLEGRDRSGVGSHSNRGGTEPAIVEWGPPSRRRMKARGQRRALGRAG